MLSLLHALFFMASLVVVPILFPCSKDPNLPIARSVGFVWLSFAAFYLTRKVEHVW
jgi:hypothetical protein